jgi:hypothetical protein
MNKDLMIGDIIYRPDCYDRVVEIRSNGIIGQDSNRGLIPFSELKPIQLTKEILEKNGFTDCESDFGNVYHYYIGEKNFISDSSLHIGTEYHTYYWLNYKKTFDIYGIRYVHELQHAFRICKIEKEIKL